MAEEIAGAPTSGRELQILFDVSEEVLTRPGWSLPRSAWEMSRTKQPGAGSSVNVSRILGDVWTLQPGAVSVDNLARAAYSPGIVRLAHVNAASTVVEKPFWPGAGSGGLAAAGVSGFVGRFPASSDVHTELTADVAAYPKPTLLSEDIPMRRVLTGLQTYQPNTGWLVLVHLADTLAGGDNIYTFYFGGACAVDLDTSHGGEFALNLRASGDAVLYEKEGDSWSEPRFTFRYAAPGRVAGGLHAVIIIPYDVDKLAFIVEGTELGWRGPFFGNTFTGIETKTQLVTYQHSRTATGFGKLETMTGAGTLRLDVREDLRFPGVISRIIWAPAGTLVDAPFLIPHRLPDATPIRLRAPRALVPDGTTLALTLYDAATQSPLAQNADGDWLSNPGYNRLYLVADYSSPDGLQTPALSGIELEVGAATATRVRTPKTGGLPVEELTISGADLQPDHENAHLVLEDLSAELNTLLRNRRRVHSIIQTVDTDGTVKLMEGELCAGTGTRQGKEGNTGSGAGVPIAYPSPAWRTWDLSFTGLWSRLADQLFIGLKTFDEDPSAPPDPKQGNRRPGWKITAIIDWLLEACGVPADMRDIADIDLRLFPITKSGVSDLRLLPLSNPTKLLSRLTHDYLGYALTFDMNAGTRGQWRLIPNPGPPYTPAWTFTTVSPVGTRLLTAKGAYGPNTSFIQHYTEDVEPLEGNILVCNGIGETTPDQGQAHLITAIIVNSDSYQFYADAPPPDPDNPDFLDRVVPIVHNDYTLNTKEAVAFVARRIFDFSCRTRRWYKWHAPLEYITDPEKGHRRPLRVNDVVTFETDEGAETVILRSVSPRFDKDFIMMCDMQGVVAQDA